MKMNKMKFEYRPSDDTKAYLFKKIFYEVFMNYRKCDNFNPSNAEFYNVDEYDHLYCKIIEKFVVYNLTPIGYMKLVKISDTIEREFRPFREELVKTRRLIWFNKYELRLKLLSDEEYKLMIGNIIKECYDISMFEKPKELITHRELIDSIISSFNKYEKFVK